MTNVIEISPRRATRPQNDVAIRGANEFASGRFSEAALSYFALVHSEPENAAAHYNLALCLQRADRWDTSCQAFERALSLDPARETARLGLGASLLYLNRLDEALAIFNECSGEPCEAALFGKAVALQLLHRFGEAENAYEAVLAFDPDSEEILSNLIALNIETRDLDRIRAFSQRLLKIAPQSPAALQGLATVALDRGDYHAAVRYCDHILQLTPDCLEAWHNLRVALDRILTSFDTPQQVAVEPGVK